MYKVVVNDYIVFEGEIKKIGGGGTKTAYQLVNTYNVILLPNDLDGQKLINQFDRIRKEELVMHQYLSSKSIPSLEIQLCDVYFNDTTRQGIYCPSFETYAKNGSYIIDSKNMYLSFWNKETIFNENFNDFKSWIPIIKPLYDDFVVLLENGIMPYGDNFNLMITQKNSEYHNSESKYALRFFGFDFTSKHYINKTVEKINNGIELENIKSDSLIKNLLEEAMDNLFYTIIENINDDMLEFQKRLVKYLFKHFLLN
jgi:hypothetical protein